jgi:hypothetical protein
MHYAKKKSDSLSRVLPPSSTLPDACCLYQKVQNTIPEPPDVMAKLGEKNVRTRNRLVVTGARLSEFWSNTVLGSSCRENMEAGNSFIRLSMELKNRKNNRSKLPNCFLLPLSCKAKFAVWYCFKKF